MRQHGVMAHDRKFRFAAQLSKAPEGTARSWAEQARKAEDVGFSAILMPDHFGDQLAPVPALAAVAAATTTLRMGRWSSATTTGTPSSWPRKRPLSTC